MTRRILFVCLGNICRSPTAEAVARKLAAEAGLAVEVDSAGTGAWHIGNPPDGRMTTAAAKAGYDLTPLRARQFETRDFEQFDLILAMDRSNLAEIERQRPVGSTTPAALLLPHGTSGREEVPDPYYEGGFELVVELIEDAMHGLLHQIK